MNKPNKHVLFVNPPSGRSLYRGIVCTWVSKAKYIWQPADFILLSALIPSAINVSYLDSFIHNLTNKDILAFIGQRGVTQVIMSMSSIEWGGDFAALVELRKTFPNLHIAVFGDVFQESFFVSQVLPFNVTIIRHPLDLRIKEYFRTGEVRADSLVQGMAPGISVENNSLKQCSTKSRLPRGIDFPLPRHEVFLNKKHRSPFDKYLRSAIVNISWGCMNPCSYCSWSSPDLAFRYRSAQSVLKELELLNRLRVREVFFSDLNFGFPSDVVKDILNTMIKRDWMFSWHCYIKAGSLTDDFLITMREAGCHTVITGVESTNLDLSRFNRKVSLRDIKTTINLCHKLGMDICGDFILGLNDSSDDWRRLVQFAIDLRLDFASFNVYTPLLGSLERRKKINEGAVKEGEWGYDTIGSKKSLIAHCDNRDKCVKKFYGRPGYWLNRLLKIKTREDLLIKLQEAVTLFWRSLQGPAGLPRQIDSREHE